MENIENIRKNSINEIKEEAKKNPKYLHPVNKERLEDMKRLAFVSGNEFTKWMQINGIMNSITKINRREKEIKLEKASCKTEYEYKNKCAKRAGFKDQAERLKEWRHKTGINLPIQLNKSCSSWFGELQKVL